MFAEQAFVVELDWDASSITLPTPHLTPALAMCSPYLRPLHWPPSRTRTLTTSTDSFQLNVIVTVQQSDTLLSTSLGREPVSCP